MPTRAEVNAFDALILDIVRQHPGICTADASKILCKRNIRTSQTRVRASMRRLESNGFVKITVEYVSNHATTNGKVLSCFPVQPSPGTIEHLRKKPRNPKSLTLSESIDVLVTAYGNIRFKEGQGKATIDEGQYKYTICDLIRDRLVGIEDEMKVVEKMARNIRGLD